MAFYTLTDNVFPDIAKYKNPHYNYITFLLIFQYEHRGRT